MGRFEEQRAFLKTDFNMLKGVKTGASQGVLQPAPQKETEADAIFIELPAPSVCELTKPDARQCIRDRKSVRRYTEEAITLEELSYLLWATQGIRGTNENGKIMRTVPSLR